MKSFYLLVSIFFSTLSFSSDIKVVSTIPSVTEMVYYLGGADTIVGVTDYCKYPVAAQSKEKIGSAFSLNYEKLLRLKPDLVLLPPLNSNKNENALKKLGLEYKHIPYERLQDVVKALTTLNKELRLKSDKKIKEFMNQINSFSASFASRKVLVVVGEDIDNGKLKNVRVAGKNTFYNDILSLIGHVNVVKGDNVKYPLWNLEKLLRSDFDMIIRVSGHKKDKVILEKAWKSLKLNRKYKVIADDYAVILGPRVIKLIEDFQRSI